MQDDWLIALLISIKTKYFQDTVLPPTFGTFLKRVGNILKLFIVLIFCRYENYFYKYKYIDFTVD